MHDTARERLPNKGLELTARSVRSCLAPASGRSSGLAFGACGVKANAKRNPSQQVDM